MNMDLLFGEVTGHRTLRQRLRLRKPWCRSTCGECGHTTTSLQWPIYLLGREVRDGGLMLELLKYAPPLPKYAAPLRGVDGSTISIPRVTTSPSHPI